MTQYVNHRHFSAVSGIIEDIHEIEKSMIFSIEAKTNINFTLPSEESEKRNKILLLKEKADQILLSKEKEDREKSIIHALDIKSNIGHEWVGCHDYANNVIMSMTDDERRMYGI